MDLDITTPAVAASPAPQTIPSWVGDIPGLKPLSAAALNRIHLSGLRTVLTPERLEAARKEG